MDDKDLFEDYENDDVEVVFENTKAIRRGRLLQSFHNDLQRLEGLETYNPRDWEPRQPGVLLPGSEHEWLS